MRFVVSLSKLRAVVFSTFRFVVFLVLLISEMGGIILGVVVPVPQSSLQTLMQLNEQVHEVAILPSFQFFTSVLSNNLQVWLTSLIPFFGLFPLYFSAYLTGQLIQIIAAASGQVFPMSLGWVVFLFLLPHTVTELASYAFAGVAVYGLIFDLIKRKAIEDILVNFVALLGFSLFLLIFAATLETLTKVFPVVAGLFWPAVLFILFLGGRRGK